MKYNISRSQADLVCQHQVVLFIDYGFLEKTKHDTEALVSNSLLGSIIQINLA